jgi:hypothetical protein
VLAFASYLLVAVAEQGGVGAGVQAVPDEPLPFRRHAGVGIDLSELSSLVALEWLEGTQIENTPMLLLPVDGDIVAAFNEPETFSAARAAIDSLVDASGNTPVTLCLHRPVSATEESVLAEAIVTVIVEDYTDSVAYLSICPGETSDTWQASVLGVLGIPAGGATQERLLAPVSIGAPILLKPAIQATDLDDNYIDQLAGLSYVGVTLDNQTPLSETLRDAINDVLNDRASSRGCDPPGFCDDDAVERRAPGTLRGVQRRAGPRNILDRRVDANRGGSGVISEHNPDGGLIERRFRWHRGLGRRYRLAGCG